MEDLDDVGENLLETAVHVDLSMLDGLDILDECVDVGLDHLNLLIGQAEQRSKSVEQSVEGSLQLLQQGVKFGRRLVGCKQK